jgi:hypothetical protein
MPGPQLPPARVRWRKASHSGDQGACVEVAALSTAVTDAIGVRSPTTVEVARLRGHIGVRDSKDEHGEPLVLASAQWAALAEGIKQGSRDLSSL